MHNKITAIYLTEITKLEFSSTVWKKFRIKEINEEEAIRLLSYFENDYPKYTFLSNDNFINHSAINLLEKYGRQGLRTLDSIQLSTSIFLMQDVSLFITYDKLLNEFLVQEKLPIL